MVHPSFTSFCLLSFRVWTLSCWFELCGLIKPFLILVCSGKSFICHVLMQRRYLMLKHRSRKTKFEFYPFFFLNGFCINGWAGPASRLWCNKFYLWLCHSKGLGMMNEGSDDSLPWFTGLSPLSLSRCLALPRSSCILMLPRWDWRCCDRRWRRRGVKYQGHCQVTINHTSYQPLK